MEDGTALFKQYYYEILSFIEKNQPCNKNAIYESLDGSSTTRIKRVNEMVKAGLIEERKMGRYNLKQITLTEKGQGVLNEMNKILAIMNGEKEPEEKNHSSPPEALGTIQTEGE